MVHNRIIFVLSLAGAGVSAYLVLAHMRLATLACSALHGCEIVGNSPWAWGFGIEALRSIPTAAFGLMAFLALTVLAFVRTAQTEGRAAGVLRTGQFAIATGGVAVAAWLTYLEAAVIHAWCQWCLLTAVITLLIFVASGVECFGAARSGPRSDS